MKNWFVLLTKTFKSKTESQTTPLAIGTRVKTRFGWGTVTGGAINVWTDKPYGINQGFTTNIQDILEVRENVDS